MANETVVHIGENSPEEVALKLMHQIAASENWRSPDRNKILETYAECLYIVQNPHLRAPSAQ